MIGSKERSCSVEGRRERGADWLGYPPLPTAPDEAFDQRGEARPHWNTLLESLGELGLAELTRRWEEAKHLIRENGVTYNVYGDPRGMERPWQLDPIPLVIAPHDARVVESGRRQVEPVDPPARATGGLSRSGGTP